MVKMTDQPPRLTATQRRRWAGFTLLEILAVTFIVAILMALILRSYASAQAKRDEKKVEAAIKAIEIGIEYYHTDYNYFPPDGFDQATGVFDPGQNDLYDNLTQHKTPGKKNYIKGLDARADASGNLMAPVKNPETPDADNLWRYNSHKPEHNTGRYDLWTVYGRGSDVVTKGNWK